jgi:hypothetical protein
MNIIIKPPTEERQLRNYLINNNYSFSVSEYFSGCKFKFNEQIINTCGYTPNYYLGAVSQIKSQVKKNINRELLPLLLNYTQTEGYYIYREKNCLDAYQYDIKGAYLMFLSQLLDGKLNTKLYKYKENKVDVNKIIGMSLLGSRLDVSFKNGQKDTAICVINELRPLFFLLRYFTIETITIMLNDYYTQSRIARYIDSLILATKQAPEYLNELFVKSFEKCYERLDSRLVKYNQVHLSDIVQFNDFQAPLIWHEQYIESLIYSRSALTNCLDLTFYRRTKDGQSVDKVNYKQLKQF